MKNLYLFLSIFAAILAFTSWPSLASDPTYTKDIQPILKNRCSKCHDYMSDKNWQIYENAYSHRFQMKEKMITKAMPPGEDIPQSERDLIIKWVDTGGKK